MKPFRYDHLLDDFARFAEWWSPLDSPRNTKDWNLLPECGDGMPNRLSGFNLLPEFAQKFYLICDQWDLIDDSPQDHLEVPTIFPDGHEFCPPSTDYISIIDENEGAFRLSLKEDDDGWRIYVVDWRQHETWERLNVDPIALLVTFALNELKTEFFAFHDNAQKLVDGKWSPYRFGSAYQNDLVERIIHEAEEPIRLFSGRYLEERVDFWLAPSSGVLGEGDRGKWARHGKLRRAFSGHPSPYKRMESTG